MANSTETSDGDVLDRLRNDGPLGIAQLAGATAVTATAVRQRLSRLMAQGLVERVTRRSGRGRPSHRYSLTEKGYRKTGANFGDLALVMWEELRTIKDPNVRRGLLSRLAARMAGLYGERVQHGPLDERMRRLVGIFGDRNVPVKVESKAVGTGGELLPVLTVQACPYPQLAEQDRGICALEKMLFSELLGRDMRLAACRLDGDNCCRFETN